MAKRGWQIRLVLALGVLALLPGCATQGSVRRLQAQITALQGTVEATNKNVGAIVGASDGRLAEQTRQLESLGERMDRLERERRDARLQELDRVVKDLKESVDGLRASSARTPLAPAGGAQQAYASAQAQYQAKNFGQAVLEFSDVIQRFPRDPLAENAQYWIAAAYLSQRDFRQALVELHKVVDQWPSGRKTADALYQMGVAYRNLSEPARAREVWRLVVRRYPASDAARLAGTALAGGPPASRASRSRN